MPGFGRSAENTRTTTMAELAATMAAALTAMQIDRYHLLGTSFGGKVALWLAAQQPERVLGLVLEAPAAIRPVGTDAAGGDAGSHGAPALRASGTSAAVAGSGPRDPGEDKCAGDAAARP